MLQASQVQGVHDFSSIKWSIGVGIAVTLVYIGLMIGRHKEWPATGAIGRMFIEMWFLSGMAITAWLAVATGTIGADHEDYVFIVLGLLLGAVICLKHITAMFHSIYKPKGPNWAPNTENADE